MKKLLLVFAVILSIGNSFAQNIFNIETLQELEGTISSTEPKKHIEIKDNEVLVSYEFSKIHILKSKDNTSVIRIEGFGLNYQPTFPTILQRFDPIQVPKGMTATVELLSSSYVEHKMELAPSEAMPFDGVEKVGGIEPIKAYQGFYPKTIVHLEKHGFYCGREIVRICVYPIQYDYQNKVVRIYKNINYRVNFKKSLVRQMNHKKVIPIADDDHFLERSTINGKKLREKKIRLYRGIPGRDVISRQVRQKDYLIVTTKKYERVANDLASWKRLLGYKVHIWFEKNPNPNTLKEKIEEFFNSPDIWLRYLTIIGSHKDIPSFVFKRNTGKKIVEYLSDLNYGCIDDDLTPDISRGRILVSSPDEAKLVVDKIINYEKNPMMPASYYKTGLNCAYFQDTDKLKNDTIPDGKACRAFAETSEKIRNYMLSQGKNIKRVYATKSHIKPEKWISGQEIPKELQKPKFPWNGNADSIVDRINEGVFYVIHRGHGAPIGWDSPRLLNFNINKLTNKNQLPVVLSLNCQTGRFNEDFACFAETFLKKNDGGCVGIIAASEVSYSFPNNDLALGIFDAMFPNPGLNHKKGCSNKDIAELGNIMDYGLCQMEKQWYKSTTDYQRRIYHCFGDPSMKVWKDMPETFDYKVLVYRDLYKQDVVVTNYPGRSLPGGTRVTFYSPSSGKSASYELYTASPISFPDSYDMHVCITAPGYKPHIDYPTNNDGWLITPLSNRSATIISCSPNPTRGIISIKYSLDETKKSGYILLTDTKRQKELYFTCPLQEGENKLDLDLSFLAKGNYLISLIVDKKLQASEQIIIE